MTSGKAPHELATDILIVGGGVGGCAAAIAVCRAGHSCILTEETAWIGGQFTSQAVPPDEHGWIERFGCTSSYRAFRNAVREYYRTNCSLSASARNEQFLNPGRGWVSPLCHEPNVGAEILENLLAHHVGKRHLILLRNHRAISAELTAADRVAAVTMEDVRSGRHVVISAPYFLDATEVGEMLPLCGVEFATGAESQNDTGEANAPVAAAPTNCQAISWCFAIGHEEGSNHVADAPAQYDHWKGFVPTLNPSWPGRLFSWIGSNPRTLEPVVYRFAPNAEEGRAFEGLWSYRRIVARSSFAAGTVASDICIVNWPMIDHWSGDLCTSSREQTSKLYGKAREQSLAFFYWLQTEAPRHDGGVGYPGLYLCPHAVGTPDGLAMAPYIRESRRFRTEFTVCEQHVSAALRPGRDRAQDFADSVGIGYYRIDLHPTTGGDNYLDVAALPFQIPLGALIPCRVRNLLPAGKNLGVTHITNGCYRVHPVEWNVGEVAGALASYCLEHRCTPHDVLHRQPRLFDFQSRLDQYGVERHWPEGLCVEEGDPHAHASL